jgi:phage-related protein
VDVLIDGTMKLWNPGDIEANFILSMKPDSEGSISIGDKTLSWKGFKLESKDSKVGINSKLNLVEGYDANGKKTGNIYNKYFSGSFFKIPVNKLTNASAPELKGRYEAPEMSITGATEVSIKYNDYYL